MWGLGEILFARSTFQISCYNSWEEGPREEKAENKGSFQGKVKGKDKTNFGTDSC